MADVVLRLHVESKSFHADGGTLPVLGGIELTLSAREIVAIVGPSGCGKTTLLRIVGGLDTDFVGELQWFGSGLPRIGQVFQEPRLLPWRTVRQNILLAQHDPEPAVADELLESLGLAAFRGRSSSLSVNPARPAGLLRIFVNGVVLQLANPKALLFFVALLPQFIDPAERIMPQIVILGVTSVVLEFLALLAYSMAASRCRVMVARSQFARLTDRIAGSCLIGAGLLTAAIRRN